MTTTTRTTMPASTHATVAHDLNQVLRTLQDNPALARALTDPAVPAMAKANLISRVFGSIPEAAKDALNPAWTMSWESTSALLRWVESTAVNAAWMWAADLGVLRQSIDEVFTFGQMVYRDHELRGTITDRRVDVEKRQELVKTLFSPTMTEPSVEVAMAAVSSRRGTIDDAVNDFLKLGADLAGGKLARVTVAKPMPDEQKNRLGDVLQARMGANIIVEEIVDPSVLGGVRVECGAEVIDSTMATRLETARRNFA